MDCFTTYTSYILFTCNLKEYTKKLKVDIHIKNQLIEKW